MMKHDKKIQRQVLHAARAEIMNQDDDDIMRNMTNLILRKDDEKG
jgi:hypothetical protein